MDFSGYTAANLADSIHLDKWAVRDEAARRCVEMEKKIKRLKDQLHKLEANHNEMGKIFCDALNA
jgi:hypothetical protein